jgi:hypothetical protein
MPLCLSSSSVLTGSLPFFVSCLLEDPLDADDPLFDTHVSPTNSKLPGSLLQNGSEFHHPYNSYTHCAGRGAAKEVVFPRMTAIVTTTHKRILRVWQAVRSSEGGWIILKISANIREIS